MTTQVLSNIPDTVFKIIEKKYGGKDFLTQYALFMGTAQILEMRLKQVLHYNYSVPFDKMEKLTLGQTGAKLKEKGVRPDLLAFLASLVEDRNYIAHELLCNQLMMIELGTQNSRKETDQLEKAIYKLEQLYLIIDWTEQNNAWH